MNFLESNQKQDVRLKIGNITLYEPTDEQVLEIKNILLNQDIKLEGEETQVDYSVVRYIIKECCENGAFIDEYTDEQIAEKIRNGNRNLRRLEKEVIVIIEEVLEDIAYETERQIKTFNDLLNVLNTNSDMEKLKNKFNKVSKKNKLGITFEDLISNAKNREELENKIKEVK